MLPGKLLLALSVTALLVSPSFAGEVRVKDITDVEGIRVHTLTGIGLVTGLNGTGGSNPVTRQFAQNMLARFGLRPDPDERLNVRNDTTVKTDNIAVVVVTAEVPAFAKAGSRIDVVVSALDDAESLQGGVLIETVLLALDDKPYAMAKGAISVGGFSFSGQAGNVQKNHPTTGRVPNGAILEVAIPTPQYTNNEFRLLVRNQNLETAKRIMTAINERFPFAARLQDGGTVHVRIPDVLINDRFGFMAAIGNLKVEPDVQARVVINERTGTIAISENVRLSTIAITHANLTVITTELPEASQPAPFSGGDTEVLPRTQVDVFEDGKPITVIEDAATVQDLVNALNALGAAPRDMSSIFQNLKNSGALHAEIIFQ